MPTLCRVLEVATGDFNTWLGKRAPAVSTPANVQVRDAGPATVPGSQASPAGRTDILQSWLTLLCSMLPAVRCAVVCELEQGVCRAPSACWPANATADARLLQAAAASLERSSALVTGGVFATPLALNGELFAIAAIDIPVPDKQQAMVRSLLAWGEQWLRLLLTFASETGAPGPEPPHHALLPLVESVSNTEPLKAALLLLANRLAAEFDCQRVVLGLKQGSRVRVKAFSHGLEFDPRTRLITDIEALMEEVLSSPAIAMYPSAGVPGQGLLPTLKTFWLNQGQPTLCLAPLRGAGGVIGVLLLERRTAQGFSAAEQEVLKVLGHLLGYQLEIKQANARSISGRFFRGLNTVLDRLLKPGHHKTKLSIAATLLLAGILVFAQGEFRVSADARIEGQIQRAVVAPFAGYIAAALARAGDTVEANQVLARLDDRELALELRKSSSEEARLNNEYRRALAELDSAEARVVQSQLAQARAQSQLLQEKLRRIQLSAPLSGMIVSGDLSRSLGAPVERGDVLFEVAPLHAYRLVLQIDERDIAGVAEGQHGVLSLTSMPGERWQFVIEQISPVFVERDNTVSYRTEARLEGDIGRLRPGMEGLGKVETGRRSLGWILLHDLLDWLRLQWWLWLP